MTHPVRLSKEITGVQCATCRVVRGVERVEAHAAATTFTLACGHAVVLLSGAACGLDVREDHIILYPNRADLQVRQGATS
jgi:hypothetical protein